MVTLSHLDGPAFIVRCVGVQGWSLYCLETGGVVLIRIPRVVHRHEERNTHNLAGIVQYPYTNKGTVL